MVKGLAVIGSRIVSSPIMNYFGRSNVRTRISNRMKWKSWGGIVCIIANVAIIRNLLSGDELLQWARNSS